MDLQELKRVIQTEATEFPEITEEDGNKAQLSSFLQIRDEYDAFYFFASMNLLNAYVKKPYASPEFKGNYAFKSFVTKGIEKIIANEIAGVTVYFTQDVTYVSVLGFQFSFHNLQLTDTIRDYVASGRNQEQEWSGIRLQPPAVMIFRAAEELYEAKK